ncbi:MAG: DUF4864 domain-containing protein [Mesorhizobium sp.]|nr:DUF4864 domain-containing protein [Mesorhizobium sp.]MBL8578778.1 DUF4864 domain-containing protein [Mesorhizobium sp.]
MQIIRAALLAAFAFLPVGAFAGDADIRGAQATVESQLKAFQSNDGELAYSFAAPSIQRIFPTVDIFMGMVGSAYQPVRNPRNFAFGAAKELGAGRVQQDVLLTGPDGVDYEAEYTLELQPDGVYRITSVKLKKSTAVGA